MTYQETLAAIKSIANIYTERKEHILNEEATKNALILPFLQRVLGYDVFNPTELVPEMPCDMRGSGKAVDYAIRLKDKVRIIIECKKRQENIVNHRPQLKEYLAAALNSEDKPHFAMLTNGLQYEFYADTVERNLVDAEPFLKIDILGEITEQQINTLQYFHRDIFDTDNIFLKLSTDKEYLKLREVLLGELEYPCSDEFAYAIAKKAGLQQTKGNLPRYRQHIISIIDEFVKTHQQPTPAEIVPPQPPTDEPQIPAIPFDVNALTDETQAELVNIIIDFIKDLINPIVPKERIKVVKNKTYTLLAVEGWWAGILRLHATRWSTEYWIEGVNSNGFFDTKAVHTLDWRRTDFTKLAENADKLRELAQIGLDHYNRCKDQ